MYQLDESAEKRILHKPCIDLERSEYTSLSRQQTRIVSSCQRGDAVLLCL